MGHFVAKPVAMIKCESKAYGPEGLRLSQGGSRLE
jgi:hypothetical protein